MSGGFPTGSPSVSRPAGKGRMPISEIRERVSRTLIDFARDQWAQMGVFVEASRRDTWAQDPEALLVFAVEVARDDARLFDEVLDWLRLNGDLVSGRRLARISHAAPARPLVEAAVEWAALHGSPLRLGSSVVPVPSEPVPLFDRPGLPGRSDETFLRHGFLKPPTVPSGKSTRPDLSLPVNFAFRLRHLFGVSTRADIVRFLLTSGADAPTTLAIAEAAVSTKRNVSGTLGDLAAAGFVERFWVGNEARYRIDRDRWARFLGLETLPAYRDWLQLLRALGEIRLWLRSPEVEGLSDYLRASEARRLMQDVGPLLTRSGVRVVEAGEGVEYWLSFVETVRRTLVLLGPGGTDAQHPG